MTNPEFVYLLLQCFPHYFTNVTPWMIERIQLLQGPAFDDLRMYLDNDAEILRRTSRNDWDSGRIKGVQIRFSCTITVTDQEKAKLYAMIENTYVQIKELSDNRVRIRVDRYLKDMLVDESEEDDGSDGWNHPLDNLYLNASSNTLSWTLFNGNEKSTGGWDFKKILHFLHMGYFDRYRWGRYCEINKKPSNVWKPVFNTCNPVTRLALKDAIRADDGFSESLVCKLA